MSAQQLLLPIQPLDDCTFTNFFANNNQALVQYLQIFLAKKNEYYVYLWGNAGVGRSHLLQACCHVLHEKNLSVIYLPLTQINHLDFSVFENLENFSLVCLDDIQIIAGKPELEEALFHLYNKILNNKNLLLLAANTTPPNLKLQLPDLTSRLMSGMVFQVHGLNDEEKLAALQLRAQLRGLELSNEVGQFLLRHYPRDFASLFKALEKLDRVSLTEQRRLTIPFVKQVLEQKF
jgi:DnaA-homolog protein